MAIILSAKKYEKKLKATVQRTGRLGFTDDTTKELGINEMIRVKFAQDEKNENILYLAITNGNDEDGFKVCKAGTYYYVSTKLLFDTLKLDYKNNTIMFDLSRHPQLDEEMGGQTYIMNKRFNKRKKEADEEME